VSTAPALGGEMSESNGPTDKNGAEASRARTVTVYDRLEEARARREKALSAKPDSSQEKPAAVAIAAKPRVREKGDGMAAVVTSIKRSSQRAEASASATYAAAPEPSQKSNKVRVAAFVAIPALIGLAAFALPLATGEQLLTGNASIAQEETLSAQLNETASGASSESATFANDDTAIETASLGAIETGNETVQAGASARAQWRRLSQMKHHRFRQRAEPKAATFSRLRPIRLKSRRKLNLPRLFSKNCVPRGSKPTHLWHRTFSSAQQIRSLSIFRHRR